jgi:hypothetical protein
MTMFVPVPDIVHRPSGALREAIVAGGLPPKAADAVRGLSRDAAITNVRFSLKDVYVIDNRDPGKGDIYLVTVVADNLNTDPISLSVKTFEDIPDRTALPIGPDGLAFYRNEPGRVPAFLDYRILVMESDQEIRDAGALLDEVRQDATFKSFRDGLLAVTGATAPAVSLATAASDFVIGLVARILKSNRDDQLIYVAGSYDAAFDDLGVTHGLVTHKNAYAKVSYRVEAA